MKHVYYLIILLSITILISPLHASEKVVVVVGTKQGDDVRKVESNYSSVWELAKVFRNLDFKSQLGLNLNSDELRFAVNRFQDDLVGSKFGALIFLGSSYIEQGTIHLSNKNINTQRSFQPSNGDVSLGSVLNKMSKTDQGGLVVIIGSVDGTVRKIPEGVHLIFVSRSDSKTDISETAKEELLQALLLHLNTPDITLSELLKRVQKSFAYSTKYSTDSTYQLSLHGDGRGAELILNPKKPSDNTITVPLNNDGWVTTVEAEHWYASETNPSEVRYQDYLKHFPKGYFSSIASERLEKITIGKQLLPAGTVLKDCELCPQLVVLPAGRFKMGRELLSGSFQVYPNHNVNISYSLAVSRTAITWDQWESCIATGGCQRPPKDENWGRNDRPVIYVSWDDVQIYLKWISKRTGYSYRLLSEAEWEYAACSGRPPSAQERKYFGDRNCNGCGSVWDGVRTAPVGQFKANIFGLYDIHGNVWEWTMDCMNKDYFGAPEDGRPWLTGNCDKRVIRGASWHEKPEYVSDTFRFWTDSSFQDNSVGFRIARRL